MSQTPNSEAIIMFTKIIRPVVTACALLLSVVVYADTPPLQSPFETSDVTIMKAQPGGFILARPCAGCAAVSLQFDINSKAFANGKVVDLTTIPEHPRSAITIIFNPTTKIVQRVLWTQ